MDPEVLKSEFNITKKDLWSLQCKFYDVAESHCLPCLMFTPPHYWNLTADTVSYPDYILTLWKSNYTIIIMHKNSFQRLKFRIKGKVNDDAVLFQLHEENQSTVFVNELDLGKSSLFKFKPGYRG